MRPLFSVSYLTEELGDGKREIENNLRPSDSSHLSSSRGKAWDGRKTLDAPPEARHLIFPAEAAPAGGDRF
jgi:hypothetical protein